MHSLNNYLWKTYCMPCTGTIILNNQAKNLPWYVYILPGEGEKITTSYGKYQRVEWSMVWYRIGRDPLIELSWDLASLLPFQIFISDYLPLVVSETPQIQFKIELFTSFSNSCFSTQDLPTNSRLFYPVEWPEVNLSIISNTSHFFPCLVHHYVS